MNSYCLKQVVLCFRQVGWGSATANLYEQTEQDFLAFSPLAVRQEGKISTRSQKMPINMIDNFPGAGIDSRVK